VNVRGGAVLVALILSAAGCRSSSSEAGGTPESLPEGTLAQVNGGGTPEYLLDDGLGSRRGVTNLAGTLTGTADYDTFGSVRTSTGAGSVFGYTGEQFDAETGYTYLRARYLNPALGRFLSADSVQPNAPGTQGYNLYAYVANNPTTWVDPSGHALASARLAPPYVAWLARPDVYAILTACTIMVPQCALRLAAATMMVLQENRYGIIPWGLVAGLAIVCALTSSPQYTPGEGVSWSGCLGLAVKVRERVKEAEIPKENTPPPPAPCLVTPPVFLDPIWFMFHIWLGHSKTTAPAGNGVFSTNDPIEAYVDIAVAANFAGVGKWQPHGGDCRAHITFPGIGEVKKGGKASDCLRLVTGAFPPWYVISAYPVANRNCGLP
jgi:RHS repeat-associated protein